MRLETKQHSDVTILSISGEFDRTCVDRFTRAVSQAREDGARDFVLDLRGLTAVDSRGLEAFTYLQRQCEEQLGMVQICGANETIAKVFEITRLDKSFSLNESLDRALACFVTA